MLRSILVSIIIIGALIAAPKSTAPINPNNLGVVKVEKLGTDNIPQKINIQGYLDSTGVAINHSVNMEFRIYDAQSGGNQIGSTISQSVNVENGLFSVKLDLRYSTFQSGDARWLEVKVENQTFTDRIEITSVGFSYKSIKSDTASYALSIPDGSVTTSKLADNVVTSPKIADGTIINSDVSNSAAISQSKISNSQRTIDADMLDGYHYNNLPAPSHNHDERYLQGVTAGTGLSGGGGPSNPTLSVDFGTGSNEVARGNHTHTDIDADMVDGFDASSTPTANTILPLNSDRVFYVIASSNSYPEGAVVGRNDWSGAGQPAGVFGKVYADGGYGVKGEGSKCGVRGYASSSGDREGGYFTGGGWAYVGANIGGTNYKIYGSGNVSCIMPTRQGKKTLFASESPEPYFEDFGYGKLTNGYCHIEIELLFLDCIKTDAQHSMKVFIQLNDDCKGVYVKIGQTGFDVYELQNGRSNATFTYRVVANRKDTDYLRFPQASEPTMEAEPWTTKIGGE